ncbi:hypothetical protein ACQKOM_21790 [Peribacillus frigoritolerans]|uniref:hypothetical protein n=1 Tax=Peribacillus frigoritolerans TaxID=450367 RepID=UPI003D07595A
MDEFNKGEFERHSEINGTITALPQSIEILKEVDLSDRGVSILYQDYLDDMRTLFSPRDEGDKRAIALARALGSEVVITYDIKSNGPYNRVNTGLCGDLIALSTTDLLCLQYIGCNISITDIKSTYEQIAMNAYEEGEAPALKGRVKLFLKWIVYSEEPFIQRWFKQWIEENDVNKSLIGKLAFEAKNFL